MRRSIAIAAACAIGMPALAGDAITYDFDGSFEDAAFAVENAIVNQGLVIDSTSHVGDMLARTGADVGSSVKLFDKADVYTFCSALISRQVMEADPMNIVQCPYTIFVTDQDGKVTIGHRDYPDDLAPIEELLTVIAKDATGG